MDERRQQRQRAVLTGVLESVDLHVDQRKRLSETVRHRSLLLLEDLCHLRRRRNENEGKEGKEDVLHTHKHQNTDRYCVENKQMCICKKLLWEAPVYCRHKTPSSLREFKP